MKERESEGEREKERESAREREREREREGERERGEREREVERERKRDFFNLYAACLLYPRSFNTSPSMIEYCYQSFIINTTRFCTNCDFRI